MERISLDDRYLLYKEAVDFYGEEHQESKIIEEMAELIQAIIKYRHNATRENYLHLLEEIADVTNTQEQLKMIHCNHLSQEDMLKILREEKLGKMRQELESDKRRLENGEENIHRT